MPLSDATLDALSDLPLFAPREGMGKLETAFWKFHRAHPSVFATLHRFALEWQAKGKGRRIGIKALYERARWEIGVGALGARYALNNNFTAFYARLLMSQFPELAGVFETRRQKKKSSLESIQ